MKEHKNANSITAVTRDAKLGKTGEASKDKVILSFKEKYNVNLSVIIKLLPFMLGLLVGKNVLEIDLENGSLALIKKLNPSWQDFYTVGRIY